MAGNKSGCMGVNEIVGCIAAVLDLLLNVVEAGLELGECRLLIQVREAPTDGKVTGNILQTKRKNRVEMLTLESGRVFKRKLAVRPGEPSFGNRSKYILNLDKNIGPSMAI